MFKQGPDFYFRDKRLFEISEVEITIVDCIMWALNAHFKELLSYGKTVLQSLAFSARQTKTDTVQTV